MNRNGLLFSLEALIAIIILASAISFILMSPKEDVQTNLFVNIKNQSNRISTVYFNNENIPETGENVVCGEYIFYKNQILFEENICEGYP